MSGKAFHDLTIISDQPLFPNLHRQITGQDHGRIISRLNDHIIPEVGAHGSRVGIAYQNDLKITDPIIDDPAPFEIGERPGLGEAVHTHRVDIVLGVEAFILDQSREHEIGGSEVSAIGATGRVVPIVTGLQREHFGLGVLIKPACPAGDRDRQNLELDARSGKRADHRPAGELVPEAFGSLIIHQLVGPVEEA